MKYQCSICYGLCDPGEIEGGICFECRQKAKHDEKRAIEAMREWNKHIRRSENGQMVLNV